jgi:signal transduction histidine kinase
VLDGGPVIAVDDRERLFSMFYRIGGPAGQRGTGLGLALARKIARRHGGDVTYRPERGNCFIVTLPLPGGERAQAAGRKPAPDALDRAAPAR